MFFLFILIALVFIVGSFMIVFRKAMDVVIGALVTGLILTALFSLICVISTCCYWDDNAKDIAQYRQIDNIIEQREVIMNKNLPEIKDILVKQYPEFEKDIFSMISVKDIEWLWMRYPQLRSAETMQNYVNQLNDYTQWYQSQREAQLKLVASIEARKNTPWAITLFVPTLNQKVKLENN